MREAPGFKFIELSGGSVSRAVPDADANEGQDVPKGERIMSKRFPRDVVISRSSSCPMSMKSFSARSMPISSHVCLMAN